MKKNIKSIITFSFFLVFCFSILMVLAQNGKKDEEKNILIVHSYHQGLEWTDNISEGILSVFEDRSDVNLIFEYLDTKRNYSPDYFDALKEMYKAKALQNPYKVIIACDNAAFDFMRQYSEKFYPGVPVVYCGVNNLDIEVLKKVPHFYGYDEKVNFKQTIASIRKVFPRRKNILIINDNTTTGAAIRKELEKVLPDFEDVNFEIYSKFTIGDLKDKVKTLDDTYAIYLLVINRDIDGNFISYAKGISAIHEVSEVPIFGSWDFYENKGLFGGKITRGFDQGKHAAHMAETILDKGVLDHISQINMVINNYVFDYTEMERFGVGAERLPENSLIINRPEKNENLLQSILVFALVLLVLTIILAVRLTYKRRRATELQHLVDEKTERLLSMNIALKEINTKKDRFFSIMSHDLRGPFSAILGFSSMLNDDFDNLETAEQKKFISKINTGLGNTYNLLEDLLSWSYAQSGSIEFNPKRENISLITKEIIEVLSFSAEQKSITIINRVPDLVFVTTDKNMISTIIRNLINNAIKFTPRKGIIEVDLEEHSNENNKQCLAFSVKDNGVGIPFETQSKLFEIGEVISTNGTDNESGTGLGLILCKEFVDKHKGEIWVESEINRGSKFVFTLPLI
ncbi:sensor histidine kinase [Lentimicrobium sp. L6]|uniref:sensor histidine kinase n=1 Tax=Lentimicrobium sp. L6 TaxID=2735916 RepID=UPI0015580CD0|nr:ATP-binding protein [Lentimicrobium sp. L6]NPD85917.1 sensor histidine kinase [Lentimicrobium sp. L6]